MVLAEVRTQEESKRKSKAVELGKQGAWTKWDLTDRCISWSDIWRTRENLLLTPVCVRHPTFSSKPVHIGTDRGPRLSALRGTCYNGTHLVSLQRQLFSREDTDGAMTRS